VAYASLKVAGFKLKESGVIDMFHSFKWTAPTVEFAAHAHQLKTRSPRLHCARLDDASQ
jgi:hypothetical protein